MYSRLNVLINNAEKKYTARQLSYFCCSLKFGCIVAAILSLAYSILGITKTGILFAGPLDHVRDESPKVYVYSLLILSMISDGVTFVLSAFLFVGVLMEILKFIRPWIIWFTLQTIVYVVFYIYTTLQVINNFDVDYWTLIIMEFLILVIRVYILLVVNKHYREIAREKEIMKFLESSEFCRK